MLMLPPGSMAPWVDFSCIKADGATNIKTSLNLVINDSLSDQLLSDPKELRRREAPAVFIEFVFPLRFSPVD